MRANLTAQRPITKLPWVHRNTQKINNNNNSVLYYLCAEPTAASPITDSTE
jgi:hypothetical protein